MKDTLGEKWFYAINYVMLSFMALTCLLPIVHIVSLSFSDSHSVTSGRVGLWPIGLTWESYRMLLQGTNTITAFRNSVLITVVGTVFNMVFTILAAYPLARRRFYARRFFTLAIVFTMLFNAGLIPNYLLIKQLGMLNEYWALWLPGLVSAWNMLVMKSFFEQLPEELVEAARMDGCNEWRLIFRMVLPLSLPIIATLALFYGVSHWNSFFNVLIYINDPMKYNMSALVQQMIQNQQLLQEINSADAGAAISQTTPETIRSAGIVVMILPMLIVYPFLQKYFVKGVMIGSIKG